MSQRLACVGLTLLMFGLLGCAQNSSPEPAQDPTPIVQRFLAARQARNLDATMEVFAEQPQVRSSSGVSSVGREAVRALMAARLSDSYTIDNLRVTGERVFWSERVRRTVFGSQAPPTIFDQDVEAVVRDGHISSLVTYVSGAHPSAAADPSSHAWLSTDLLLPLSMLALVAGAVLAWPSGAPRQAKRIPTGHLIDGLREYVARRGSV